MKPRLLITGATGFLGLACVRHAIAAGVEVHALARRGAEHLPEDVTFHAVDIMRRSEAVKVMDAARPTHLLHLGWITTPGAYWTSPANRDWLEASEELLLAFGGYTHFDDDLKRRAVLTGSCAEYDWTQSGVCGEQDTPAKPATLYGQCKDELRRRVEGWGSITNHSAAWARLFFLYGPREHPARLVPSVVNALLAGQPAECTAGTQERDFLHVDDAAAALVQLVLSDVTGPVNIGSGEAVSVKTVVETIADIVGRPDLLRLGAKAMPPNEPPLLVADVGRVRDEVKWAPQIGLRRGLEETVAWWRERNAG